MKSLWRKLLFLGKVSKPQKFQLYIHQLFIIMVTSQLYNQLQGASFPWNMYLVISQVQLADISYTIISWLLAIVSYLQHSSSQGPYRSVHNHQNNTIDHQYTDHHWSTSYHMYPSDQQHQDTSLYKKHHSIIIIIILHGQHMISQLLVEIKNFTTDNYLIW